MPTRRVRLAVALTLPIVLTATACSGDDDPAKRKDASASATSRTRAAQTPEAKALVAKLKAGVAKIRTAHFAIAADVGGQRLAGSGEEKLANGALTALRANATLPGAGAIGVVVVDGKQYAKLPPPLATKAKPWLSITADSSNAVVKQVAGVLDAALAAATLDGLSEVVATTTTARNRGTSGGRTRYAITVDPTRLPDGSARSALGSTPVPAQLWVDASGRPVRVEVQVTLLGQPTDTTVSFSRFDQPVTVTPPPAGQIASG